PSRSFDSRGLSPETLRRPRARLNLVTTQDASPWPCSDPRGTPLGPNLPANAPIRAAGCPRRNRSFPCLRPGKCARHAGCHGFGGTVGRTSAAPVRRTCFLVAPALVRAPPWRTDG